jgi:transcriptional regulator with XRE-family HTH domain
MVQSAISLIKGERSNRKADVTPMAVGESPAAARRRLRLALRKAREAKQLTQRQVAQALDWSLSKVNRIESGEVGVTSTDLQAMLRLFEITDPDLVTELTAAGRVARRRGWWDQPEYREHLTPAMIQSVQFETEATEIRSYQPTLIPGVLQTRAYASAILDAWSFELPHPDRTTRREVRMLRREQLFGRPEPAHYLLLLEESVLLREVGGPRVMSEQLYNLIDMSRNGRAVVRVLPLVHAAAYPIGLFMIYADDDEDIALYRESSYHDEVVYAPEVIRQHRQVFERMWDLSFSEEQSIHSIEAHAATLRSAADRIEPSG